MSKSYTLFIQEPEGERRGNTYYGYWAHADAHAAASAQSWASGNAIEVREDPTVRQSDTGNPATEKKP